MHPDRVSYNTSQMPRTSSHDSEVPISVGEIPLFTSLDRASMSSYLKFFSFEGSPFEGEAASKVVLGTRAVRDALAMIEEGLQEHTARICVSGEAGLGKTSLARALPKLLGQNRRVAVITDIEGGWDLVRTRAEKKWQLSGAGLSRSALVQAARSKQLVLVLDEAEKASEDLLDHLDVLLSYRDENENPLVQCVLFARLSGSAAASPPPLLWWLDRLQTHQLVFQPLRPEGVASYIEKHLSRAGWTGSVLFQADAAEAIHSHTGGVPGQVGLVCQELLEAAAAAHRPTIDADFVHQQLDERLAGDVVCESEFEDLISEEEFDGAHPEKSAESEEVAALLDETLARFAAAEPSSAPSRTDAAQVLAPPHTLAPEEPNPLGQPFGDNAVSGPDLEAYLSSPATEAELHALSGGGWKRMAAMAAGILLVLAIGAGAWSWLRSPETPDTASPTTARKEKPLIPVGANKPAAAPERLINGKTPKALARLTGPITPTKTQEQEAASSSSTAPPASPASFPEIKNP